MGVMLAQTIVVIPTIETLRSTVSLLGAFLGEATPSVSLESKSLFCQLLSKSAFVLWPALYSEPKIVGHRTKDD